MSSVLLSLKTRPGSSQRATIEALDYSNDVWRHWMYKFHSKVLAMISQNIYSLHTPVGGILYPLPSLSLPLSSLPLPAWRCSRWPCQSGPCVPAGIQLQSLKRPKVTKDAYMLHLQPWNQSFSSPADFFKLDINATIINETRKCLKRVRIRARFWAQQMRS